jgi:hypothetical protein
MSLENFMALTRLVRRITVRCPVAAETFAALVRGEFSALEVDAHAAKVLGVIRGDNPLGDFGLYRGVFEVGLGIEGFTPTERAVPTAGQAGANALSPTVRITTYVDPRAPAREVQAALDLLVAAHPWEVPVIEMDERPVQLLMRSPRR